VAGSAELLTITCPRWILPDTVPDNSLARPDTARYCQILSANCLARPDTVPVFDLAGPTDPSPSAWRWPRTWPTWWTATAGSSTSQPPPSGAEKVGLAVRCQQDGCQLSALSWCQLSSKSGCQLSALSWCQLSAQRCFQLSAQSCLLLSALGVCQLSAPSSCQLTTTAHAPLQ
jgi:hypothetical protein